MKNPFTQRLKLNFNRINLTFLFIYVLTAVISCDKPEGSYSYPYVMEKVENTVWKWEYTLVSGIFVSDEPDYLINETNDIYHIKFYNKKVIFYHNYRKIASYYEPYPEEPRGGGDYNTTISFNSIRSITFILNEGKLICYDFPVREVDNHPYSDPKNIFFLTNEKL